MTGRRRAPRRTEWPGFTPDQLAERAASVPAIVYPEELPVSARREEIVTTFRLRHELNTGDILLQDRLPIAPDDNVSKVHDHLMLLGAKTTQYCHPNP